MYSLVLMSAMTTAPNTVEFNGFFSDLFSGGSCSGCSGCSGCCGGTIRYNCSGGGCCGSSQSCSGCCGGGLFSGERLRSLFAPSGCNGCCGGNAARSYGCNGSAAYSCTGCSGSAAYSYFNGPAVSYTPVFNGGLSCYGGPTPFAPPPVFDTFPSSTPPPIQYAVPEAPGTGPAIVPVPSRRVQWACHLNADSCDRPGDRGCSPPCRRPVVRRWGPPPTDWRRADIRDPRTASGDGVHLSSDGRV